MPSKGEGVSDEFRIDSHKLMFHPREVSAGLQVKRSILYMSRYPLGQLQPPLHFCALDYMEYRRGFWTQRSSGIGWRRWAVSVSRA